MKKPKDTIVRRKQYQFIWVDFRHVKDQVRVDLLGRLSKHVNELALGGYELGFTPEGDHGLLVLHRDVRVQIMNEPKPAEEPIK